MKKKGLYLVQAVYRSKYGQSKSSHRIVTAVDAIGAARECFVDLPNASKRPGIKFPELFKVYPCRDLDTFMGEVGALTVKEDDDSFPAADAIVDLFEARAIEVRL